MDSDTKFRDLGIPDSVSHFLEFRHVAYGDMDRNARDFDETGLKYGM